MTTINQAEAVRLGSQKASRVYLGSTLVWEQFKPTDYTGCKIWLDASSLNLTNGQAVAAWPNLAGTPNPTMLGTPAPTFQANALNVIMPVVRTTQGQGRYWFTGTGVDKDWTLIYVGRKWQLRGGRNVAAQDTAANLLVGFHATEMDVAYIEAWLTSSTTPVATTAWKLYSADSTSVAVARFFINGSLYASGSATPLKGWGGTLMMSGYTTAADVAVSQQADCEVAELIQFNRKLTDVERQKIEGYLKKKWGV